MSPVPVASAIKSSVEDDQEDDWETDDEQLVHVELSGIFQDDLKKNPELLTKFVGIETDQPIVQLGNQVFAGKYEDVVGTTVFFKSVPVNSEEQDPDDPNNPDPVFDSVGDSKVEYFCKTEKKLLLKRVFLNKKDEPDSPPASREAGTSQSGTG